MNPSISSPSPFEIPHIKNAKVGETEIKTIFTKHCLQLYATASI